MDAAETIWTGFQKLYQRIKDGKEITEEDLRVAFVRSGILEALGYKEEFKDFRSEKIVKGKRSDLLTFDDYQNVAFAVEFKRPNELDVDRDFAQLWERYVKPLRARYGVLTDGLELLIYKRIDGNSERIQHIKLGEITLSECESLYDLLKKPEIKRTRIEEVLDYFERFDKATERVNLSTEIAQQHFFESFELNEGSVFVNLVQKTIALFDFELNRAKFLTSAYEFWKVSYAKKPEKIPENWQRIMATIGLEATEENLFKFMFCLESAYSLFTRLILAKACEDYKMPYSDFSDFIKREIKRIAWPERGDISSLAWPITTKNLIDNMKKNLVKSVFEGDIFYWWEDGYKALTLDGVLYSPYKSYERQKARFGDALADIILTLYKFDFSEIVGDPLGTLYQRYFDKETRKALGEFYTPLEVVTYILDAVGYEGRSVLGKRLLDPACGSGTFLVEALRRYLKASEQIAGEKGWPEILKELCNKYCIVGFDIHPFATFMAQMQFMLVLIPAYKKAMEEDHLFVLNRLPIFRTDSLIDETKGETRTVTLEESAKGVHHISIDTGLPVDGGNMKIEMPYRKVVTSKTDLYDVQEYFAALQAIFDTVKEAAKKETYVVDTNELELNFKRYLGDKNWSGLVAFFMPYAENVLQKFKELKDTFGDGKLIKSLEDIMLAAVLKNYVQYDFVVGNPPYVNIKLIKGKENYKENYLTAYGRFDLYVLFMERGINWLNLDGFLGFITSNKFTKADYGKKLRKFILDNTRIIEYLDFGDSGVFKDATNYPCIVIAKKTTEAYKDILYANVIKQTANILELISENLGFLYVDEFVEIDKIEREDLPFEDAWAFANVKEKILTNKIQKSSNKTLSEIAIGIRQGISSAADEAFVFDRAIFKKESFEEELIHPLIFGNEIKRWGIIWSGNYTIYPYSTDGTLIELSKYPKTYMFLKKFKEDLEKRYCVNVQKKEWFEYDGPRAKSVYEGDIKIVTPDISNKNKFAISKNFRHLKNTCYVINLSNGKETLSNFILGLLNSNMMEFYFKHISPFLSGGYYRYKTQYLERLPIKLPQTPEEQNRADKVANKVKLILEKVKLEQKIEHFPDEYIQEFRSKGEEFFSPPITFDSDHKALEPIMEAEISGRGYNIVLGKKEKPLFVESELKANYVVAALKGKRAMKDEKPQLLIPKSDTFVESILTELEEDKVKVASPSVNQLEAEINALVYELYGLNEENVQVIEDFLRRF